MRWSGRRKRPGSRRAKRVARSVAAGGRWWVVRQGLQWASQALGRRGHLCPKCNRAMFGPDGQQLSVESKELQG
jgi:hypothetical protein